MTLQDSVLKTLKYSDHFGFPLKLSEIHFRLISSEPCSLELVFGTLQLMLKSKTIQQTQDYYHLPGKKSLVAQRINHLKSSKSQLSKAHDLSLKLSRIPFIKAIFLTGSLAMFNSEPGSDVDFMIITQEGRLWTTRFILTIITSLLGLRRTPSSRVNAGKLCLNLYLCPSSYALPVSKQNLYTAYELIQAVPLYDPSNTRALLLAANPWIGSHLANFAFPRPAAEQEHRKTGILEHLLFNLQYLYMKKKLTREYITIDSAFFHPRDPGSKVLSKLE